MSKKPALGRGFEGLIPTGFDVSAIVDPSETIRNLAIEELVTNPDQPRKSFDEAALQELAESIKVHGVIQPLVATPYKNNYRIVAGERRFRASKIAGLKKVPVIVRNHKELEELEIALVENVQRVDLSPLEQAISIVRLKEQFSLTPKEIAKKLGKAETTVSNIVRLLQLPPEAIKALQNNDITEGHARAILALKTDEKLQKELLNTIITQKLSVREAEEFVKQKKPKNTTKRTNSQVVETALNKLSAHTRKATTIKERDNGSGSITIRFKNHEELNKYIQKLASK